MDDYRIAYLRDLSHTNQCELSFHLKTEIQNVGTIDDEVNAVRQLSDTIESLMKHIQNKVKKMIQDKFYSNKENQENEIGCDIAVSFKRGSKSVKHSMVLSSLPHSLLNGNQPIVFQIFDNKFRIVHNAPVIRLIKLPVMLYANFTTEPIKFHGSFIENANSTFIWYRSMDKDNWEQVGNKYKYSIKEDDLGHYLKLKCIPSNSVNMMGPSYEVISENKVDKIGSLPTCPFERRHEFTRNKLVNNELRVVSYNILADRYAVIDDNFTYCDPRFLAIDYRKQLIIGEVIGYNADIVCLQEVDNRHYNAYFKDEMKERGFGGIYNRKGNRIPEGLALFYNISRFSKAESKHIVLSQEVQRNKLFSDTWKLLNQNPSLKQEFTRQSTSLQVTILKCKTNNKYLLIGNTHLYYHPEADHIRLLQINMATTYMNWLKNRYLRAKEDISVIFCGDFNSSYMKSLFPYMLTGRINPTHEDCLKINENGRALLFHNFHWVSAYGTPKYTNYTPEYKGCLDYIFVESLTIDVLRIVPLPDENELEEHEGLPNEVYPSDHLALVVDLKLKC